MGNPAAVAIRTGNLEAPAPERRVASRPEPTIDLVHLARQTLGDRSLETELLALFARQAGHAVAQLAGATLVDAQELEGLAHKLCGSARAIGATGVAEAAARLEASASAGGGAQTQARNALVDALRQAREAIAELLSEA